MNNCENFIILMHMYIDGETDDAEETALMEHVENCPGCKALLASYDAIAQASRQTARPAPYDLHSHIMTAVHAEKAGKNTRKHRIRRNILGFATAAAMLAVILAGSALWPKNASNGSANDIAGGQSDGFTLAVTQSVTGGETGQTPEQAPQIRQNMMSLFADISDQAVEYPVAVEAGYAAYYLAVGEGEVPEILPEYGEVAGYPGLVMIIIRSDQAAVDYASFVLADAGFVLYGNVTNAPQADDAAAESLIVVEKP